MQWRTIWREQICPVTRRCFPHKMRVSRFSLLIKLYKFQTSTSCHPRPLNITLHFMVTHQFRFYFHTHQSLCQDNTAEMMMNNCPHTCSEYQTEERPAKRQRLESSRQSSEDSGKRRRFSFPIRRLLRPSTSQHNDLQASLSGLAPAPTHNPPRDQFRPSVFDRIKQFCRNSSTRRHRQDSVTNHCNSTANRLYDSSSTGLQYKGYNQDSLQRSSTVRHRRASDGHPGCFNSSACEEVIAGQRMEYLDSLQRFHGPSQSPCPAKNISRVPYTNFVVPSSNSFSPQLPTQPIGIPARPEVYRPSSLIPDTARPVRHNSFPPPFGLCEFRFSSPSPSSSRGYPASANTSAQGNLLYLAEPCLRPAVSSPPCSPLSLRRGALASRSVSSGMIFSLSPDPSMQNLAASRSQVQDLATPGYESDIDDPGLHMSPRRKTQTSSMDVLTCRLEHTSFDDPEEAADNYSHRPGTPGSPFYLEHYLPQPEEMLPQPRYPLLSEWADPELVLNHCSSGTTDVRRISR